MTTDLEKKFFEKFGIEPKLTCYDLIRLKEDTNEKFGGRCLANWQGETKEETIRRFSPKGWKVLECKDVYTYPQIKDTHYLELICILNPYSYPSGKNIQHLKEGVLEWCIKFENDIKQQVQELFKE